MLQILVLHKEKTHLQMILFISSVSGVGGAKLMQGVFFPLFEVRQRTDVYDFSSVIYFKYTDVVTECLCDYKFV